MKETRQYIDRGNAFLDQDDNKSALKEFNQALELDRNDATIWHGMGNALMHTGELDQALKAFEKSTELDEAPGSWTMKGLILLMQEKYELAIEAFDNAIKASPNFVQPLEHKAICLEHTGRHQEAVQVCNEALRIDKNSTNAWGVLGDALYGLKKFEDSVNAFSKAIAQEPRSFILHSLWERMGRSLWASEDYKKALSAFEVAIELEPGEFYPWLNKAVIFHDTGHYGESKRHAFAAYSRMSQGDISEFYRALTHISKSLYAPLFFKKIQMQWHQEPSQMVSWQTLMASQLSECNYIDETIKIIIKSDVFGEPLERRKLSSMLKYHLGNPFDTVEDFSEIINERESDLLSHYYLIFSKWMTGASFEDELAIAVKMALSGLKKKTLQSVESLYYAGLLLESAEEYEHAKKAFSKAYQMDNSCLEAKYMEMLCCRHLGEEEDEDTLCKELINIEKQLHAVNKPGYLESVYLEKTDSFSKPFIHYIRSIEISEATNLLFAYINEYQKNNTCSIWMMELGKYQPEEDTKLLKAWLHNEDLKAQIDQFKTDEFNLLETRVKHEFADFLLGREHDDSKGERLEHQIAKRILDEKDLLSDNKKIFQELVVYYFVKEKISQQQTCLLLYYIIYLCDLNNLKFTKGFFKGKSGATVQATMGSVFFSGYDVFVSTTLFLGTYMTYGAVVDYISLDHKKRGKNRFTYEDFRSGFLKYLSKKTKYNNGFFKNLLGRLSSLVHDDQYL